MLPPDSEVYTQSPRNMTWKSLSWLLLQWCLCKKMPKAQSWGWKKMKLSAAQQRAREEQRRRQQRQHAGEEQATDVDDADRQYDKTGELSRQGVWVDVKV